MIVYVYVHSSNNWILIFDNENYFRMGEYSSHIYIRDLEELFYGKLIW